MRPDTCETIIRLAPEAEADLGGGAEERGPGGCVTGAHPAPLPPGTQHAGPQVPVDSTAVCCWVLDLISHRGMIKFP